MLEITLKVEPSSDLHKRLVEFLNSNHYEFIQQPVLTQARVSSSALDWDDYDDDDYDEQWDEDDIEERRQEELEMRAAMCTCGAWQMGKSGVVHVADCCCGAE